MSCNTGVAHGSLGLMIYLVIFYVQIMNGTFAKTDEFIHIRDMGLLIE